MPALFLSVVIPAYNEERNVPQVLRQLSQSLRAAGIPHELLVVDDCSSDGTAAAVNVVQQNIPEVALVRRTGTPGLGRAIRAGLQQAKGDAVVITMADGSDAPGDVVSYYRKLSEGYDCVFGSRFAKGSQASGYPLKKLLVNRLVNRSLQVLFLTGCNDLTNAFKAYRREVIERCWPYRACHYDITIEMSLRALLRGCSIAQIPISWQGRTWGSSHLKLSQMGHRYLSTLLRILSERRQLTGSQQR